MQSPLMLPLALSVLQAGLAMTIAVPSALVVMNQLVGCITLDH